MILASLLEGLIVLVVELAKVAADFGLQLIS
jgi:hypothetical protein